MLAQISPAVFDIDHVQRLVGNDKTALHALLRELRTSNFHDLRLTKVKLSERVTRAGE